MPKTTARPVARALLATAATLALATPAAHAEDDDDLNQTVAPEEENVTGEAVLDTGHVDIGPRFVDGEWRIQGRDDSQSPPVWRSLTDVVTRVTDASVQQAPDDPDFGFLDAEPGSDVHVIPQTQAAEVIWLGWNTQDPEVIDRVNRGATLTMHGVDGPGHFSVFLQNGTLQPPEVLWDGDESGPQELWVDVNTHTHANWVFTEPGVYVIDFEVSADLITGEHVSDRAALRFAVGDGTDVRDAFAAGQDPPGATPSPSPTAQAAGAGDGAGDDGSSSVPAVLLGVGGATLLLAAAVTTAVVRGRRARAQAEAEAS